MARVIFNIKVMPEDISIDLTNLEKEVRRVIEHFKGFIDSVKVEEVAYGLKALNVMFMIEDKETDSDVVEDNLRNIPGVGNLEIIDIRRAFG